MFNDSKILIVDGVLQHHQITTLGRIVLATRISPVATCEKLPFSRANPTLTTLLSVNPILMECTSFCNISWLPISTATFLGGPCIDTKAGQQTPMPKCQRWLKIGYSISTPHFSHTMAIKVSVWYSSVVADPCSLGQNADLHHWFDKQGHVRCTSLSTSMGKGHWLKEEVLHSLLSTILQSCDRDSETSRSRSAQMRLNW